MGQAQSIDKRIIHISGAPGSGKSYLKKVIEKTFRHVTVFDTDEFIQHHIPSGKLLLKMEEDGASLEDYKKEWTNILDTKIADAIASTRDTIVFVGVLSNFAPSDGTIYEIKIKEDIMRLYLDIPLDKLLRQYYCRLSHATDEQSTYWNHVADRSYNVMSSFEVIDESERLKKWHLEHLYKECTPEQIITEIRTKKRLLPDTDTKTHA